MCNIAAFLQNKEIYATHIVFSLLFDMIIDIFLNNIVSFQ